MSTINSSNLLLSLFVLGCIAMLLGLVLGLRKSSQKEAESHSGIPKKTQKWINLCRLLAILWVLETPFLFLDPRPTVLAILVTAGLFLLVAALIIHQAKTATIRSLPEFGGAAAKLIALGSAIFGLLMLVVAFLEAQSQ